MTPSSGDVTRRLLRDQIYDVILEAILDGTLEPGEVLHDDALASWLGASRTPIREALTKLAERGVVEFVPHRYTRVAPLDLRLIDEGLVVAGMLHEDAVRRTVETLREGDRAQLGALLASAADAQQRGDVRHLGPAIRDFFAVYERATGNRVLVETIDSLFLQVTRFLTPREDFTDPADIIRQLQAIVDATNDLDAKRAGDLTYALYEPTRRRFLTDYRNAPAATTPSPEQA